MKKIISFTLALIVAFFMVGCMGSTPAASTKNEVMPKWYINPPANSNKVLFGAGEGYSKDEAVQSALSNLASRLSVSIESVYKSSTTVQEGTIESYSKKSSNDLKSEVAKIRVSNYKIVNSKEMGDGRFLVLVSSNKAKFFSSLVKEFDIKVKTIKEGIETNSNANPIKRYAFYKKSYDDVNSWVSTLLVLNTLNSNFDDKTYLATIKKVNSDFEQLKKSMSFYIDSDKASVSLVEPIRVALTNKGIKVTKKKLSSKNSMIVFVSSRINKVEAKSMQMAKMAVNIEVKNSNGAIIGGNKLNLIGRSFQGYELAKENASKQIQKTIKKKGIGSVIGVEF